MFVYICEMENWNAQDLSAWHDLNHESELQGRYITLDHIRPLLESMPEGARVTKEGASFQGRDIFRVRMGTGRKKVLIWTQMHGNESTGTKAFFDLCHFLLKPGPWERNRDLILQELEIVCIPMLNPDGAQLYTRTSAQEIDLNRDVLDQLAPESRLLRAVLGHVDPVYCFNLHDQRTIFSVGSANNTATVSFLAPSEDLERTVTEGRKKTMQVIISMNQLLQQLIPDRVGRYTDEFYPTATGDNFQRMGHNTVLIESGHASGDYSRRESRKYTFMALLQGLYHIASGDYSMDYRDYFAIPDNAKQYLDVIVKGVKVAGKTCDLGVLYREELHDGKVEFRPGLDKIDDLCTYNADRILPGYNLDFSGKEDAEKWVENAITLNIVH